MKYWSGYVLAGPSTAARKMRPVEGIEKRVVVRTSPQGAGFRGIHFTLLTLNWCSRNALVYRALVQWSLTALRPKSEETLDRGGIDSAIRESFPLTTHRPVEEAWVHPYFHLYHQVYPQSCIPINIGPSICGLCLNS